MITIQKSHSLYKLVSLLGDALKEKRPANPLQPQTIIVPNLDTARWLKLELAERMDIAANLECILPSEWQYRQIRLLYPGLPKKLPSDILPMTWSIYKILIDDSSGKQFSRLCNYISRQPDENRENAAWQLSEQISSVFDQYIVYRPELLLGWQKGYIGKQPDEEWQARLWNLLNRHWKLNSDSNLHKNRAELYADLYESIQSNKIQGDSPIFLFNPGLIPKPTLKILKGFGAHSGLTILRISLLHDENKTGQSSPNPLIESLGRELMDLDQVYEELFGGSGELIEPEDPVSGAQPKAENEGSQLQMIQSSIFDGSPVEGKTIAGAQPKAENEKSQLQRIQSSIFDGSPVDAKAIAGDTSIRIHACHSPLREVETLYQSLLELFESDPTLHPDDILVTTPDPAVYEPFIRAVFGTSEEGLPEIPWHISIPGGRDSAPERTFTQWLNLLDSRFQFHPVMELFSMKPVWEWAGIDESDIEVIRSWMEENSVIWGLDGNHRNELGQPATDYQTWHTALRRGWLGQWMADEAGIMKGDTLLFAGIRTSSEKEAWAAFSSFMFSLDRTRTESKELRTAEEWCNWIRHRFELLTGFELLGEQEGASITAILDVVNESAILTAGSQKISFSLIRSILINQMDQLSSSGAIFTRGITFSSMVPVRSIPFRVIASIGLNESSFPRKQAQIDFDLMAQNPKSGERNRKFEDRNLFLESVIAAKQIHYVSYIGQSPVDNDKIPPSTIVNEWIDHVAAASGLKNEDAVRKESLHAFSESYYRSGTIYSKSAFQAARTLSNNENPVSGLNWPGPLPDDLHETPELIGLTQLVRFYKNPVRTFVSEKLGARLTGPEEEKDEFSSNNLEKHILFQRLFGWVLNGLEESDMYNMVKQSGLLPDGLAGETVFKEIITQCRTAIRELKEHDIEPVTASLEINTELDGVRINDVVPSFLAGNILDITPSSLNGGLLLQSWIRHLAWNLSNGSKMESCLLCEIKKGRPVWARFKPAESPLKYLNPLVQYYLKGQREPLLFFPKSLYKYEDTARKRKDKDPFKEAAFEFEGSDWKMGERSDLNVTALLGRDAPYIPDYSKNEFRQIIGTMIEHLEVSK